MKQFLDPQNMTRLVFGCIDSEPKTRKLITVCVHGDEICGLIAVNELIEEGFFEETLDFKHERVTIILGNPKAVECNKRFVDINLNRIFTPHFMKKKTDLLGKELYEVSRLEEIAPEIEKCDEYLDIHSTSAPTVPFAIVTPGEESENIAKKFPVNFILHNLVKVIVGTSLDHAHAFKKIGCCVECGQHRERQSVEVAKETIQAFLSKSHSSACSKEILFVDKAEILHKGFKFCVDAKAFDRIQYNELIARDDVVGEMRCPYEQGAFLIMPIANPVIGEEAWLWGHSS